MICLKYSKFLVLSWANPSCYKHFRSEAVNGRSLFFLSINQSPFQIKLQQMHTCTCIIMVHAIPIIHFSDWHYHTVTSLEKRLLDQGHHSLHSFLDSPIMIRSREKLVRWSATMLKTRMWQCGATEQSPAGWIALQPNPPIFPCPEPEWTGPRVQYAAAQTIEATGFIP